MTHTSKFFKKFFAGLTEVELAAEKKVMAITCDVNISTVNHWFRGFRSPSIPNAKILCEFYNGIALNDLRPDIYD